MKKYATTIALSLLLAVAPTTQSHAIIWKIITEAAKKIIRAIDLNVQRLQNKTIGLQNVQKEVENVMAKLKLKEIGDWTEKQRKLYQQYYDELKKVRDAIATYKRVRQIIERQIQIVAEYRKFYTRFKKDPHLTAEEIVYIGKVYTGLLDESVKNLDQLFLVVNAFATQMSDAKRLELISDAADKIETNYADLKQFNQQNLLLILGRIKDHNDIEKTKTLYGIQ